MTISSHTEHTDHPDPGAWRIAMDATEVTLWTRRMTAQRPLYVVPDISGTFYLRRSGTLAGFALRLPLPATRRGGTPVLEWESEDLENEGRAWLRLGHREVCRPVSVLCAEIPGARPYVKIVMETVFSSLSLRPPAMAWGLPRKVTLRLFSEVRPTVS